MVYSKVSHVENGQEPVTASLCMMAGGIVCQRLVSRLSVSLWPSLTLLVSNMKPRRSNSSLKRGTCLDICPELPGELPNSTYQEVPKGCNGVPHRTFRKLPENYQEFSLPGTVVQDYETEFHSLLHLITSSLTPGKKRKGDNKNAMSLFTLSWLWINMSLQKASEK